MKKKIYMVLDIGGTKIALFFFDPKGRILGKIFIPTKKWANKKTAVSMIYDTAKRFLQKKNMEMSSIKKLAVGCPGPFDHKKGKIFLLPNLHFWKGFELKKGLKRKFKVPVYMENDANLAGLGEAFKGSGKGHENVVYMTFSTGIGGGFIHKGRIVAGATGDAMEIGHITVMKDGPLCGCGKRGCLEAVSSGSAMARIAKEGLKKNKGSLLNEVLKRNGRIRVEDIVRAVRQKDRFATKIWFQALDYLAIGIADLIQILNPDIVVIGGGISNNWDLIITPLKKGLKKYAWERPLSACRVVRARLGDEASAYGGFKLLS